MKRTIDNERQQVVEGLDFEDTLTATEEESIPRHQPLPKMRLLWECRSFLFRVMACGLVASTLIAFLIPNRYKSTARLMPPETQSGMGLAMLTALSAKAPVPVSLAGDLLGIKSSSALFVGIMHSRTAEDSIVKNFDLQKVYRTRFVQGARKILEENTEISEDRKSGIISVTVTDKNPQRAAAIAQAYVEQLDRLVAQLTTSAAHRERVFLEEHLKGVKTDLDMAAKDFSEFSSKNAAIDIKEQGRAMVEAAATLQGQLIAAQSQLEGLRQIYTEENVRVRSLRARISELQKQLDKMGGQEGDLGANLGTQSLYPSIRKLPLLSVTYSDLYRRTKIQETVYELLTSQYEMAKVQEAKEIPSVKVLDDADVPEKKSFPPRLVIMLLGMCLSLVVGMAWIFASARYRETDPNDPGRVFAKEVLGTLKAQVLALQGVFHERVIRDTSRAGSRNAHSDSQPGGDTEPLT